MVSRQSLLWGELAGVSGPTRRGGRGPNRTYGLLWSAAPCSRQEQVSSTSPVEHSLKLRFSLLF